MKEYYYIGAGNQQFGPFPKEELVGKITLDTMVWAEGMPDWAPARTVEELSELFAAAPQTPPAYNDGQPSPQPAYSNQQTAYNNPQPQFSAPQTPSAKPDNYLVWAILSTILCCLPLGIVSIVYSAKVDGLWEQGAYEAAQDASRKAKTFAMIAAISGFVVALIYGIVVAVGVAGASHSFDM